VWDLHALERLEDLDRRRFDSDRSCSGVQVGCMEAFSDVVRELHPHRLGGSERQAGESVSDEQWKLSPPCLGVIRGWCRALDTVEQRARGHWSDRGEQTSPGGSRIPRHGVRQRSSTRHRSRGERVDGSPVAAGLGTCPGSRLDDPRVHGLQFGEVPIGGVPILVRSARLSAHRAAEVVARQTFYLPPDVRGISWAEEEPGQAVLDDFGERTVIGGDHGDAVREGLGDRNRESLVHP
jgi:hypothetical protein